MFDVLPEMDSNDEEMLAALMEEEADGAVADKTIQSVEEALNS